VIHWTGVCIDCADAEALAAFYGELLGREITCSTLRVTPSACSRATDAPPRPPTQATPQPGRPYEA